MILCKRETHYIWWGCFNSIEISRSISIAKEKWTRWRRRMCPIFHGGLVFKHWWGRGGGGANRDLVGHTLTVSWGQRCGGNDFGQLLMPFGKDAVVQKCKLTLLMLSVDYSKLWMFHSLQIAYLSILSLSLTSGADLAFHTLTSQPPPITCLSWVT